MVVGPIAFLLWFAQLIAIAAQLTAIVVLTGHGIIDRRWKAVVGLVIGTIIGHVPFFFVMLGREGWLVVLLALISSLVLVVIYAAERQWVAFAVALVSSGLIVALHPVSGLLAPIACALACSKVIEKLAPAVPLRRNA